MALSRGPGSWVWLAILLSGAGVSAVVAQGEGAEGAREPRTRHDAPEAIDVALPEELRESLAEIAALREGGDVDAARELMRNLAAGEAYSALLEDEPEVLLRGLGALDAEAGSLGLTGIQEQVREETVVRLSARLPADHPDLLRAKSDLAVARHAIGDFVGALALWREVLAAYERILQADDPELIHVKANLAATLHSLSDFEAALALEEEVLFARERLLAPEHPDLLHAKANLATTLHSLGDLDGALALEEEVLAAYERTLRADDPELISAKSNLAVMRYELGDIEGAMALLEQVLAAWEGVLPDDHPNLLILETNLAVMHHALGNLEEASALQERVLAVRERSLAPDHVDVLIAKANLAATRHLLGDLEGALELGEEVLAGRERLLAPDHPDLLRAKANLASTRHALGDVEGALVLEEEVLAVRQRLLAPDHPELLLAKANLAVARRELGDLEGALELEEEVLAARERLLASDHPDLLRAKANLASTRHELGDLEGALLLEEEVLAARARLLPADHPDLVRAKANLAATLDDLGDLDGARVLEEEVLAARARLLAPDHPDLLSAEANLAWTYRALGDLDAARRMTRSLLESQGARARSLRTESSRVARAAALLELHRLSTALSLNDSAGPPSEEGLDGDVFVVLENLRIVSTGDPQVASAARRAPELEELRLRLDRSRYRLNELALSGPDGSTSVEDWRQALAKRADDRDRIERELRSRLAEKGVIAEPVSIESVAAGLETGGALISYFRYRRRLGGDAQSGRIAPSVDSLLAFVVTPDESVRRIELGPAGPLESLAIAWLDPNEREVESERGRALRERLLDPCLEAIGGESLSTVHVVLDDFLHLVPFEALPWEDGRRTGEVLRVRREVSVQRLSATPQEDPPGGTLVAFGGVDFDADAEDARVRDALLAQAAQRGARGRKGLPGELAPLLQSGPEVQAVAGLYRERGGPEPVVRTGGAATKQSLFELAPGARYLHLATHGWFAEESVESTRDVLEEDAQSRASLLQARQTLRGFAPETLCGVALAGANRGTDERGEAPGILTAEELRTLDLSGCELAVLSACETNVGIRRAGQGIQSLQAALHVAGARASVTSLWKVDDEATRLLMTDFYGRLWGGGTSKADALWEAKQWLRSVTNDELAEQAEDTSVLEASSRSGGRIRPAGGPRPVGAEKPFADPVYWAGFVLTGNPD